jgi:hypothetical protein
MTTGRNLAAKPRSAIQTSLRLGSIDQIEHFLLDLARPSDVEKTPVGRLDEFNDLAPNLFRNVPSMTTRPRFLDLKQRYFAIRQAVHAGAPAGKHYQ